jgi:arylsulfatase A-like enzyme
MKASRKLWLSLCAGVATVGLASSQPSAQQQQKPNILFIMGDDIGFMQPSIYHRGLMVGETPNIDRIGNEGAIFMDYLAMQSYSFERGGAFADGSLCSHTVAASVRLVDCSGHTAVQWTGAVGRRPASHRTSW